MTDKPAIKPVRARQPRQKRGQVRVDAILDATERLLDRLDPREISIYTVAEEAGLPPASVYHFFADAEHIFTALAERFFAVFEGIPKASGAEKFESWQALWNAGFEASRSFFNANKAARKIIFGAGSSWLIRAKDIELDRRIAERVVTEMADLFVLPQMPGLIDRVIETIVINDALWSLSNHMHGYITDEADEYAKRARVAHARTYLPEFLELRRPTQGSTQEVSNVPLKPALDA